MFYIQPYAAAYWQIRDERIPVTHRVFVSWFANLARVDVPHGHQQPQQQSLPQYAIEDEGYVSSECMMNEDALNALEGKPRPPSLTLLDGINGLEISSGGPNSPKMPPPAERITSRPTTSTTIMSPLIDNPSNTDPSSDTATTRVQHSNSLSHARTPTLADIARQTKRLSLNFPPPSLRDANSTRSSRPLSLIGSPVLPPIQSSPSSPDKEIADSPTKDSFLTHIAAQERRVLELKEELGRAERELEKLKKQWAQHEVQRKKQDAKRTTQLKPLAITPSPALDSGNDSEDVDGSSNWMQHEMERRKQMLSGVRRSNTRVFSGGRHTRTLSLLSPERTQAPSFPQPPELDDGTSASSPSSAAQPPPKPLTRSSTTASLTQSSRQTQPEDNAQTRPSLSELPRLPSDALLKTGKQMATDLKDGLWTFFEDIRQATVGDEAITGTPTHRHPSHVRSKTSHQNLRRQRSGQSLDKKRSGDTLRQESGSRDRVKGRTRQQRPMSDAFDIIGGDFWSVNGFIDAESIAAHVVPKRSHASTVARGRTPIKEERERPVSRDSEAWDSWDTPASKQSAQIHDLAASPASEASMEGSVKSTPRTSTSSAGMTNAVAHARNASVSGNREAIPWPALAKGVTGHLKRTASNLMSEWERSVSVSPGGGRPGGSSPRYSPRVAGADEYFEGKKD